MKLLRYLVVGGIAAIVDIGLFSLLTKVVHLHWFPVSLGSFTLATLVNYYLSIAHVFESGSRFQKHHEILLVFIVSGVALVVNQITLYFLIEQAGFHAIQSKFLTTGIVFFVNYFARKNIIFKKNNDVNERANT